MKDSTLITQMTTFLKKQEEAEKLLQEAKDREIIFIDERYKDVLRDYYETKLELNSIVADFIQLCDENPEEGRSDENTEWLQESCDASFEAMEDLNSEFHARWGNRYQEYEQEIAAVNTKYDKLLALAQNPAALHAITAKKTYRI